MKTETTINNLYKVVELKPKFDSAKSFYGKANVIINKDIIILKSYATNILEYNQKTKKIKFLTKNKYHFTQTTNRHINEFLKQFTQEQPKTRKELLKAAGVQA